MALMVLFNGITTSLNNKKTTTGIYIDMKKVLDTVNREILLKKFFHSGLCGIVYQ